MAKKPFSSGQYYGRREVTGTSGKTYIVSRRVSDHSWACSCNAWTMQKKEKWVNGVRVDCQHILQEKMKEMELKGVLPKVAEGSKNQLDDYVIRAFGE